MSNIIENLSFDFLKEEFPKLAKDGNYANQYFDNDPDGCLNKIRRIGEFIVYEIYKKREILEEYCPTNQKENIEILKRDNYINYKFAENLRDIQEKGSVGSHVEKKEFEKELRVTPVSDEARKELLRKCYDLCLWFANEYGAKHTFFDKMKEFFWGREKQKPSVIESFSKTVIIDEKKSFNCFHSLSALGELSNSILCKKVAFDNFIDETFFDKQSVLNMFRFIPEKNIRISTSEVPQWLYKFIINDNPTPKSHEGPNLPVENVSWYDAVIFCNRLSEFMGISPAYDIIGSHVSWEKESHGFRLPTIDEWQEAAKKNIYDAWGNVGEWCEDYYKKRNKKAVCGCAWNSGKEDYTKDSIRDLPADTKRDTIGFRIVHDFK